MTADAFITQLKNIFNDSSIADATMENLVDAVVDELNLQGCTLSNMAGTAGSKTITLTSAEKGAVRRIFRVIYASWHKNADNTNVGVSSLTMNYTDLMSNPTVMQMIEDTATALKFTGSTTTDPPIYIGNSPLPQ